MKRVFISLSIASLLLSCSDKDLSLGHEDKVLKASR